MSTTQITKKIEDLPELEKLMDEAKAEADILRNEIKDEMLTRGIDVLMAGRYVVRWIAINGGQLQGEYQAALRQNLAQALASRHQAIDLLYLNQSEEKSLLLKSWIALQVTMQKNPIGTWQETTRT